MPDFEVTVEIMDALVTELEHYLQQDDTPVEFACEGETRSATLARVWSHRLLRASTANGLHGCLLCQG